MTWTEAVVMIYFFLVCLFAMFDGWPWQGGKS